jgi:hypothetical protein
MSVGNKTIDEVGANEAGAAGNHDAHNGPYLVMIEVARVVASSFTLLRFITRCTLIELFNFFESNRAQIVTQMLVRAPKDIPAYSRVARNDLKTSIEYIIEAYTDLIVTGDEESLRTYYKFLAKVRVSQSFKLGDVIHKNLLLLAVLRPMLQEKFRGATSNGLNLYNKAMDTLERSMFRSISLLVQVWSDYIKSRVEEHNEYVDEDNKQLGIDMSKFILFRG